VETHALRLSGTKNLHFAIAPFPRFSADDFWLDIWDDAIDLATKETGISGFPETCPWDHSQIMDESFWPDQDSPVEVDSFSPH